MWNGTDPARRRELIEPTWSPDATYVDPVVSADRPDALDAMVAGVHQRSPRALLPAPGRRPQRPGQVGMGAHRAGRGQPVAVGVDFAVLAADGRLRAVTGFFAPAPDAG